MTVSLFDLQDILAETWLDGNVEVAGILLFIAALLIIFALTKNISHSLIISLPVTMIFSVLGILSNDVTILLIIVTVLSLAYATRKSWS